MTDTLKHPDDFEPLDHYCPYDRASTVGWRLAAAIPNHEKRHSVVAACSLRKFALRAVLEAEKCDGTNLESGAFEACPKVNAVNPAIDLAKGPNGSVDLEELGRIISSDEAGTHKTGQFL